MFIWSVKLNRNIIWGICAALCLSIGAAAAFSPKESADVLKHSFDTAGKTTEQQVTFLQNFGYEAEKEPVLIEEIVIPSEFSEEYTTYNDLQKISGFDLSKFKGYRAKKYTYRILNYPDYKGEVVANLIVYKGKIIGGDVSSKELNGFTHGLTKG